MQEANAPYFLKYLDTKTGELKKDAPEQAKKDFRKWQREPDPFVPKKEKSNGQQETGGKRR